MNWKNGNLRIWIFRALVLIACVMMVVSFIMPWWVGRFNIGAINIYGWGLRHNVSDLANYIAEDVTPVWQVVLAWVYVGTSIGLALGSTWIKRWWGQLVLGLVGLGVISYAFVALNVVVKNRLADFSLPMQGIGVIGSDLATIVINSAIHNGYYMAYVAGGMFVVLALMRRLITGKRQ
jgi:hypothetical protein